jgi:hypothetical protein
MWKTVEEFADWYKEKGFPFRPPQNNSIYRTNNASAVVLWREGRFQAELYIADANDATPEHSHPGVESIIVYLSGDGTTTINSKEVADPKPFWDLTNEDGTSVLFKQSVRIDPNDTHGLITGDRGFAFLSLEMWPEDIDTTSVTVRWEGETTGNVHNNQIVKTKGNE